MEIFRPSAEQQVRTFPPTRHAMSPDLLQAVRSIQPPSGGTVLLTHPDRCRVAEIECSERGNDGRLHHGERIISNAGLSNAHKSLLCKGSTHGSSWRPSWPRSSPSRLMPGGTSSSPASSTIRGRYAQAITAAARLRGTPVGDGANLVLGRSYLEQFRKSADRANLVAAREALRDVRPAQLTSNDRIDYLVGLGESLYLDESYGPAVELFQQRSTTARTLGRVHRSECRLVGDGARPAGAVGVVRAGTRSTPRCGTTPGPSCGRMPGSAAATYWLVVALELLGDLPLAWDIAVAGLMGAARRDQGRALRADLDQLVLQAMATQNASG